MNITEQERINTTLASSITDAVGQTAQLTVPAINDTGYGVLYNSNIAAGETVHWNARSGNLITLDQRGLDGSTAQSWDTLTTKFITGPTLAFMEELRTVVITAAQLNEDNTFTVSPKVPTITTEGEQVMSREEIIANYGTGIAGVSSVDGETGIIILQPNKSKNIIANQMFN